MSLSSSPTKDPIAEPHVSCVGQARILLVGSKNSIAELKHFLALTRPKTAVVTWAIPPSDPLQDRTQGGPHDDNSSVIKNIQSLEDVLGNNRMIDQVWVSLPLVMGKQIRQVVGMLERSGVQWRFFPTFADQVAGRLRPVLGALPEGLNQKGAAQPDQRDPDGSPLDDVNEEMDDPANSAVTVSSTQAADWSVDPAALLDRRPAPLDELRIRDALANRCVLITGAGGSIGSQLARMVCRFQPAKLVLVERSENALFEIDHEIRAAFPNIDPAAVLHDVADASITAALVDKHRPAVIFHAAAHKHVPMMEDHPAQAVENNFYGTRSIADAAAASGAERFVMISTDKAVNPTSVMGATKRLAELYVQHLNTRSACRFAMVRFGNVLGSACSVLPIWTRQLARGESITVTHPEMHRYFMTIPEAAGLVLQAASLSQGGEVFVLDMGESIRVLDLAKRFLRSHGLDPETDVRIRVTGARPGEKLFEELAYSGEDMAPTPHRSVHIWRTTPPDPGRVAQILLTFERLRSKGGPRPWRQVDRDAILTALRWAVPEMVQSAAG